MLRNEKQEDFLRKSSDIVHNSERNKTDDFDQSNHHNADEDVTHVVPCYPRRASYPTESPLRETEGEITKHEDIFSPRDGVSFRKQGMTIHARRFISDKKVSHSDKAGGCFVQSQNISLSNEGVSPISKEGLPFDAQGVY